MGDTTKTASTAMWGGPMTSQQALEKLAKAACALDKLANWTDADDDEFGDPGTFAAAALVAIGCNTEGRADG